MRVDATRLKQTLLFLAGMDFDRPLNRSANRTIQRTRDRILFGITPDGQRFTPLSPRYAMRKQGVRILEESGDMVNDFSFRVASNKAIMTSDKPYSATHQFGDSSRNIPQREFMGFSDRDADEIEEVFAGYVDTLLR